MLESLLQEKSQFLKETSELRLELKEARSQGDTEEMEAEREMERIENLWQVCSWNLA